ncbi:uncharacterized protein ACLA_052780 [Aspergillus clavatus NRRL 1]|uniref:Ankyrin repeat protein n=1 Tax=Aspergillus clavatus (strain ATCC 1007 / CBS 513.65 / DSM 816 / NCTC 3887 / NRRL 1 / QM 1276 / 107) TaxID=344612 RepID=A1CIV0_ASPCL|nr:Ankyrin repeat protein [Aspergillus clavatus NRRL 1]EAW10805.1 Ankyrin repeat protein [Aspergillus clavatus NRRL 1]
MADPLSIAGLLLQAIEIAGKVYDFAKQVKDAKSEIRELFGELFALKAVFEQMRIERIADSSLKSDTSPSPFRDALLKANTVLEEILEDLMSRSLRQSRLSRLGWPGRKASLQGSIAQLERLKTYFILVIMNDKTTADKDVAYAIDSIADWGKQMKQMHQETQFEKVKEWISPVDVESAHRQARSVWQPETGSWFIRGSFKSWFASDNARLLFLEGKSGSGKTVLCSTTIEAIKDLIADRPSSRLAYYYCSFRSSTSQELVYLLGSLLVQLSNTFPGILQDLTDNFRKKALPPPDVLIKLILKYTKQLTELFIVVDAVNESHESESIIEALVTLLRASNIHMMISSTSFPPLDGSFGVCKIQMMPSTNKDDIQAFLDAQLESVPTLRRLPEHTKRQIENTLIEKAHGMFRYVQCQIDLLIAQRTGRDVIRALETMPGSLHGTYESILCRIPAYDRELARETLLWLTFGFQEIKLSALSEALVLIKGEKTIDDDCRLFDPSVILSICQGLVVYDEHLSVVTLAHSSVKTFLTSESIRDGPAAFYSLTEVEGSRQIYEKCLTYLMLDAFQQPCPNLDSLDSRLTSFPLLGYASENWAMHCRSDGPLGPLLVKSDIDEIMMLLDTHKQKKGGNYTSWVQVLLYEAPVRQALITPPLYYAASFGMLPVVNRLIETGVEVDARGGRGNATPLIVASFRGQTPVVQRLLEAGANPRLQDAFGSCSLRWAVKRQWRDVSEILLAHMSKQPEIKPPTLHWGCCSCGSKNILAFSLLPCLVCEHLVCGECRSSSTTVSPAYPWLTSLSRRGSLNLVQTTNA